MYDAKRVIVALSIAAQYLLLSTDVAAFFLGHPAEQSRRNHISSVTSSTSTELFSLKPLVDEIIQSAISSTEKRKTIFVGGKGGVGKTTVSSSLAVELATQDLKVLIVSTDPAHSLGDALDVDLRRGRGEPIVMTDPLTRGNLYASEINAEEALNDFRESLASFDVDRLAQSMGIPIDLLDGLGLREFSGLLNNPPPGLDELVALGNVMDDNKVNDYDVVIVDTAPTGHTLRLLALPKFLDGLLGKLIKLRMKLSGVASTLQAFLGDSAAKERAQTMDNAMDRLDEFRIRIKNMEVALRDESRTDFVVVTIPTKLAVAESKRLVSELTTQGIAISNVVVNQCVTSVSENAESEGIMNYYQRRRDGQNQWIEKLKEAATDVSSSEEYKTNGSPSPITVTELPFFDVELVGIPALGYVGNQQIVGNDNFQHLMMNNNEANGEPKVIICGGKGGVGKSKFSFFMFFVTNLVIFVCKQ
jgi:arsenite-transporting ATPase